MKRLVIMCRLCLPVFLLPVAAVQAVQEAPPAVPEPAAEQEAKAAVDDNPELTQTVDRYRDDIRQLQMQHGAFAPGLSETLLGLGDAYSQMGSHEEAVQTFKSALYISRVNSGLYSLTQLPYLDRLIEEYSRLGDMQNTGNMYSYMYWLYKRNYGDNDLRTLAPIERMQTWMQKVYEQDGAVDLPIEQLHRLNSLNYKAVAQAQTIYGKLDPRLIDFLLRYSVSNLIEAQQADSKLQGLGYDFDIDSCFGLGPQTRGDETYFEDIHRKLIIERCNNYRQGKLALQHILTIYKANNLSVDGYVRTVTRIGDWEMLFQQPLDALRFYSHAYDILEEAGQGQELMDELFGQPRLLTTAGSLLDKQAADQSDTRSDNSSFALVSLDVSRNGKARNIKVVQSVPADDTRLRYAAQRYVRAAYFRPRMQGGKSVETQGVIVTYHGGE
jgi:tetratricopeptide (TPR) repeat protein